MFSHIIRKKIANLVLYQCREGKEWKIDKQKKTKNKKRQKKKSNPASMWWGCDWMEE